MENLSAHRYVAIDGASVSDGAAGWCGAGRWFRCARFGPCERGPQRPTVPDSSTSLDEPRSRRWMAS